MCVNIHRYTYTYVHTSSYFYLSGDIHRTNTLPSKQVLTNKHSFEVVGPRKMLTSCKQGHTLLVE